MKPSSRGGIDPPAAVAFTEDAVRVGLTVRLFGSVACWWHCESIRERFAARPTPIADIDLVGKFSEKRAIEAYMVARGWTLDRDVAAIPGARYSLAYVLHAGKIVARCDIYYDVLAFSHTLDLRGRLLCDCPTLSVADLLLSKLQIAEPSESDRFDMAALFSQHELGAETSSDTISSERVVTCCASSWGLYTTVTENLSWLSEHADRWELEEGERAIVTARVSRLHSVIAAAPKSLVWRCRSVIGKRWRWYDDIDPIGQRVGESAEGAGAG